MSETIIAISPGDIAVEFDNGAFSNTVPLKRMLFEKTIQFNNVHVDGIFDVGSEYLNSTGENVLDKLFCNENSFNVKSITRSNSYELKSHVYDELKNLRIFKVQTNVPPIGGDIVTKRYYFATDDAAQPKKELEVPNDDVRKVEVVNTINVHDTNLGRFSKKDGEELASFIDSYISRKIRSR
jgi:hypothetical protein